MRLTWAIVLITGCLAAPAVAAPGHPNIVVILADDFGVGDIQSLQATCKVPTPHLDRLIAEGVSFTDAHSGSAVCTPSRYGLLTGRYSWRTRLQEWVIAAYEPPLIDKDTLTLPGYLKNKGYHTACIGKWHLGWNWPGPQSSRMVEKGNAQAGLSWDFTKPIADGPTTRGFDTYFGVDLPNLPPFTFIANDRVVVQPTEKFKRNNAEGLSLPGFSGAPTAPGWDLRKILPTITDKAVAYIHARAKTDQPFFLYFPMTSPHAPVSPSETFKGVTGLGVLADFLAETDASAGAVIQALADANVADNTIVIFTADNGPAHYGDWRKLAATGHKSSGPYRGYKSQIYEGGHRVPLIVRWPGRIKPGSTSTQMACVNDIMATCAAVLGDDLPAAAAPDSISFLPAMLGKGDQAGRSDLVNHSVDGEFAYRSGPWKLIFKAPGSRQSSRGKSTVVQLYNLADDIAETNDLAAKRPDIVKQLTEQLQKVIDAAPNDSHVRFDTVQDQRWAPALEEGL